MATLHTSFRFIILQTLTITLFCRLSIGQLASSERRILLQLQQQLEHPPVLQAWSNWTNFCYLQSSASLNVVCSGNHITELTIVGNKSYPTTLSDRFSIDSFFTVLTKLSSLKVLSLVSLGLWGTLAAKIDRLYSLQILNISSNSIYGKIPPGITKMINLQSLVLANNMLNGSVPLLSKLAAVRELDLSNNRLGPGFPSINNFDQLKRLDISLNQFTGSIPSNWFSLPSIQYLNVAGNNMSGTLSMNISCSGGLVFVNISQNYLFGKLPRCIQSNSSNRAIYYTWNCLSAGNLKYQHPDAFCHQKALAARPAIQDKKKESTNEWAIILTIGIIAFVVTVGLVIFVILRRVKMKKAQMYTLQNSNSKRSSIELSPNLPTEARHVSPIMRFGTIMLRAYHVFSLDEIEEATDNFDPSNLMGEGSQGQLYKGCLKDGSTVAVRCIRLGNKHSPQRLLQHMDVISKLRHQHLVSVLGHCIVTQKGYPNAANTIFLLFEYVSNSTLRNHLIDHRKRSMLKWPQRIALTVGIAKGIQFLHTGITPGIFGNNLKIENILLDQNIIAKISNYNLLIPSKMGTGSPLSVVETPDKLDSTLPSGYGEKEDVYHFGAILLEVIMGKPITSQNDVDVQRLQVEDIVPCLLKEVKNSVQFLYNFVAKGEMLGDNISYRELQQIIGQGAIASLTNIFARVVSTRFGVWNNKNSHSRFSVSSRLINDYGNMMYTSAKFKFDVLSHFLPDGFTRVDQRLFKSTTTINWGQLHEPFPPFCSIKRSNYTKTTNTHILLNGLPQLEESISESQLKVRRVVDPSIHGSYAYQSLKTAAEIAITCLSKDPTQRPTVEDIIWNLQYSVQVQDGWAISCENPHRTIYSPQLSMEIGL